MKSFFWGKKKFIPKNIFNFGHNGKKPDYSFIWLVFFIVIVGLVMLSSASNVESFRDFGNFYYLLFHQVFNGFIPGLILFFIFFKVDYKKFQKYTIHFFIFSVILLLLVFIPKVGLSHNQAQSWVKLGFFSFQPSEVVKLFIIFVLAGWFSQRQQEMTNNFWNGLVPFAAIIGIISLPIILQPDVGSLFVILAIAFIMYFIAGANLVHLFSLILIGLGAFGILIAQAPYRAARLMTFLHPELDPQGIGYHINQAFLAIGSGGWFGLGFGQSRQKLAYLPEVLGDSIFAVIAEEIGFIFSAALIILFLVLFWQGLKIAKNSDDIYGYYLGVGLTCWFVVQAFLNIAGMLGLMPLTGIPLPFISYGGTALAACLSGAGVLANISKR